MGFKIYSLIIIAIGMALSLLFGGLAIGMLINSSALSGKGMDTHVFRMMVVLFVLSFCIYQWGVSIRRSTDDSNAQLAQDLDGSYEKLRSQIIRSRKMRVFDGMLLMVIGLGAMVFTGVCSFVLYEGTEQAFFIAAGFLPFLFSCSFFLKGHRIYKQNNEPMLEDEEEILSFVEQVEEIDMDSDFFNEPY